MKIVQVIDTSTMVTVTVIRTNADGSSTITGVETQTLGLSDDGKLYGLILADKRFHWYDLDVKTISYNKLVAAVLPDKDESVPPT